MMTRRLFLGTGGVAVAIAAKPSFRAQVGINIYSLRYRAEKDLPGTLALIRDLGFREVEAGDLYGCSPAEFAGLLKSAGLRKGHGIGSKPRPRTRSRASCRSRRS